MKVQAVSEIVWQNLKEWVYKCIGCRSCITEYKKTFPSHRFDYICPFDYQEKAFPYSPGGRIRVISGILEGIVPLDAHAAEILYKCTACKACQNDCLADHGEHIVDMFIAAREHLIEEGMVPSKVKEFLENINKYGNPWGEPMKRRAEWAKDLKGIRKCREGDEYLLYVGCVESFDPIAQKIPSAFAELLTRAGVTFGILGEQEKCSGNEVRLLGEKGLFEELVENNIKMFKDLGVKKIVTISPHAYHVFRNIYPRYGNMPDVIHYTQLLHDLIKTGKLKLSSLNAKITYHDPCFLGRYNNIYDEPREILKSIPGIELVEMKRNREYAFCCGGGSGNFYMEYLESEDAANRVRVREAFNTGAKIIAVACGGCATLLNDGIKSEDLEGKIEVMDVAEIVKKALA